MSYDANANECASVLSDREGVKLSRRHFNTFLYSLYKCEGANNVTADAVYEGDDFIVEIFLDSPDGLMVAVHHGFAGFNYQKVDVYRPAKDPFIEEVAA